MDCDLLSLSDCILELPDETIVSVHEGRSIRADQFRSEVSRFCSSVVNDKQRDFAVYHQQAYPFAVTLFGLLHAGKRVWITGSNTQAVASELLQRQCELVGEWPLQSTIIRFDNDKICTLAPIAMDSGNLVIFTSGSTGKPKAIEKQMWQFQLEIETLETLWSRLLNHCVIIGTVSHQHIYGLIFRVMWPLLTRRCFYSQLFLSPESLLAASDSACWIASPAQLKRMDDLTPWAQVKKLRTIFSSGGALSTDVSQKIADLGEQSIIEIYGSSETGGIGWRQQRSSERWIPFQGVELETRTDDKVVLTTPYLTGPMELDDNIVTYPDRTFSLLGRKDRIVKVEEKRLSLIEMENSLSQIPWINEAWLTLISERRDIIAAAITLTDAGAARFAREGRLNFIKSLKSLLRERFDALVLPRRWLFLKDLPLNHLGKVDSSLLLKIHTLDSHLFPQIQSVLVGENHLEFDVLITPSLRYFIGHFPGFPILPGVTQISWSEHFAKLFFGIELPFSRLESVKFKKIIVPEDQIKITLDWKPDSKKLYFDFSSIEHAHSSGRILYGVS